MRQRHAKGARNRLDLNDRVQVRIVRKRLKISDRQLSSVVQTVGNSITAVTKEANSRKGLAPLTNRRALQSTQSRTQKVRLKKPIPLRCRRFRKLLES